MSRCRLAMRRLARLALVALITLPVSAHVGSPNVIFDGKAGPYDVRVIVRPPGVVPGEAEVTVRVPHDVVHRVWIRPIFWRAGTAGAPRADEAALVPGERHTYAGRLWFMRRGAYSIYVTVDGPKGSGTAVVPVDARPTVRLDMNAAMGVLLVALAVLIVAGFVAVVHAGAGEGLTEPGDEPSPRRRRTARVAAAVAVAFMALLLLGGARWWRTIDARYRQLLARSVDANARVRVEGGRVVLELAPKDSVWLTPGFTQRGARLSPVVPDHGKMMHLFLVSDPDMRALAHLHPVLTDSNSFRTTLPSVPAGRYRVYGDVVFELGTDLTLTDTVEIPAPIPAPVGTPAVADPDDSWSVSAAPVPLAAPGAVATLADSSTITWLSPNVLRTGKELTLRFAVRDPTGKPAVLEPYLGMTAHAVIARADGGVFIHLHPMGTVSAAAQQAFVLRDRGETTATGRLRVAPAPTPMTHPHGSGGEISLPYEFPGDGRYRVWIQVKCGGRILTGAFDAAVGAASKP